MMKKEFPLLQGSLSVLGHLMSLKHQLRSWACCLRSHVLSLGACGGFPDCHDNAQMLPLSAVRHWIIVALLTHQDAESTNTWPSTILGAFGSYFGIGAFLWLWGNIFFRHLFLKKGQETEYLGHSGSSGRLCQRSMDRRSTQKKSK